VRGRGRRGESSCRGPGSRELRNVVEIVRGNARGQHSVQGIVTHHLRRLLVPGFPANPQDSAARSIVAPRAEAPDTVSLSLGAQNSRLPAVGLGSGRSRRVSHLFSRGDWRREPRSHFATLGLRAPVVTLQVGGSDPRGSRRRGRTSSRRTWCPPFRSLRVPSHQAQPRWRAVITPRRRSATCRRRAAMCPASAAAPRASPRAPTSGRAPRHPPLWARCFPVPSPSPSLKT